MIILNQILFLKKMKKKKKNVHSDNDELNGEINLNDNEIMNKENNIVKMEENIKITNEEQFIIMIKIYCYALVKLGQ